MKESRQLLLRLLAAWLLLQHVALVSSFQPPSSSRGSAFRLYESTNDSTDKLVEKTWRHVKKPLLSIGGKGATASHGNSLKELLECHTAVKVKVNLHSFGTCRCRFWI